MDTNLPTQSENLPIEEKGLIAARDYSLDLAKKWEAFTPIEVKNTADRETVYAKLTEISDLEKELKAKTEPVRKAIQTIEKWFSGATKSLDNAKRVGKSACLKFDEEQARLVRAAQAAQQAIENAAAKAKQEELELAAINAELAGRKDEAVFLETQAAATRPAKIAEVDLKPKGAGVYYTCKLVNIALVPREYLQLNESMVGAIAKGCKGHFNIPGLELVTNSNLSVRKS
jgi:DNA repair exonuclease SbcCD ATPase subunit